MIDPDDLATADSEADSTRDIASGLLDAISPNQVNASDLVGIADQRAAAVAASNLAVAAELRATRYALVAAIDSAARKVAKR